MFSRRVVVFAVAAVIAAVACASALAAFKVGFQSDPQVLNDDSRNHTLDLIVNAKGSIVRLMLIEHKMPLGPRANDPQSLANAEDFLKSIQAAKARNLTVMVTLFKWQGRGGGEFASPTPDEMKNFIAWAVQKYGPWVDYWGPNNEPNHPAFWVAPRTLCTIDPASTVTGTFIRKNVRRSVRFIRVSPGSGSYRRVKRWIKSSKRGTHKRINGKWVPASPGTHWLKVAYVPSHTFRAKYEKIVRRAKRYPAVIEVPYEYDRRTCELNERMDAYRTYYDWAAKIVRMYDPTAKLVALEMAPGRHFDLVRNFFKARKKKPKVDIIGLHSYSNPRMKKNPKWTDISGLEHAVKWARKRKMKVCLTETGFRHPSKGRWWSRLLTRAKKSGAHCAILYTIYGASNGNQPPDGVWDTGLISPNGSPRKGWISVVGWQNRQ